MLTLQKAMNQSIMLDAAYLNRSIPALIDQLATEAMGELDDADETGDTTGSADEAVVSGQAGGESATVRADGL